MWRSPDFFKKNLGLLEKKMALSTACVCNQFYIWPKSKDIKLMEANCMLDNNNNNNFYILGG